jgi:hypothetical protein
MGRHSKQCLNLGHYAQGKKQEASPDSDKENIRFIIIEIVKSTWSSAGGMQKYRGH